jgi:hypothetical protein
LVLAASHRNDSETWRENASFADECERRGGFPHKALFDTQDLKEKCL